MMKNPTKMVCEVCRSSNVTRDGLLRWNGEAWELAGELDCTQCEDCGEERDLEEEPADEPVTYIEHETCELINEEPATLPGVGETVEIVDMTSRLMVRGIVVEVHQREVRLRVTQGEVVAA